MTEETKNAFRDLLPKNSFARGVSVLVGGTAGAQILLVLVAPLLTRLYSPEDFGLLAVCAGLLALIGVVSSLRYELAIPLPENDQRAATIVVLCLILTAISSTLVTVLVIFLGDPIAAWLEMHELADYLWLLPVGVLASGAYSVFNYWGIRSKRFTSLAAIKLHQVITTLVIQLTAFNLGGIALLLGQIAGQGMGAYRLALPALKGMEFKKVSCSDIRHVIMRYKHFPIFTTWAGIFNSGGTQLPPIMIAALFGASGAGLYALAHRVLSMPISLLGEALQSVFFSNAAEAYRNDNLSEKVKNLLDVLTQIALPPAFILALTAPGLFASIFGEDWRSAGVMAQWMVPWLVLQFCVGPLTVVNVATENQRLGLLMQAQLFIVRISMVLIGAYYEDLMLTILLFSLGSAFSYVIFLWSILQIVGLSFFIFLRFLMRALLFSSIVVLPYFVFINPYSGTASFVAAWITTALLVAVRYFIFFRHGL